MDVQIFLENLLRCEGEADITATYEYSQPVIDVHIPYEPERKLGAAYNRAISQSKNEWVLLLDHDTFLVNPNWYSICQNAIRDLRDKRVGLITCVTNFSPATDFQISKGCPASTDITDHIRWASEKHNEYGSRAVEIFSPIAGYFMLINKKAWETVGGFSDYFDMIDIMYSFLMLFYDYRMYVLPGLYVYHANLDNSKRIKNRSPFRNINFKTEFHDLLSLPLAKRKEFLQDVMLY